MQEINWDPKREQPLELPDATIYYYPNFLSSSNATALFQKLHDSIPWQHDPITVFGKTYMQPRLTSLHGTTATSYTYSDVTMTPQPMTAELNTILTDIHAVYTHEFNVVLLNLYRDGKDSNGWHADNEKSLGPKPVIASVSLGEERFFHFKHRDHKTERYKLRLAHGSLLIMADAMQEKWLHQIAKTNRPIGPRINLTFRKLIGTPDWGFQQVEHLPEANVLER